MRTLPDPWGRPSADHRETSALHRARRAWTAPCALLGALLLSACGGPAQTGGLAPLAAPDADDDALWPDPAVRSLQAYLVLTSDPQAMQGEDRFAAVDAAVNGTGARYAAIRERARLIPSGYKVEWEVDFADLPHPTFSPEALAPLLKELPPDVRARAAQAKLAVMVTSRTRLLPQGDHIRLAGIVPLYIADTWGGIVLDLMARRAYTADAWQAELSAPRLGERQLRLATREGPGGTRTLYTRGNPKYGVPELEMGGVVPAALDRARAAFAEAQRRLLSRGPSAAPTAACQAPPGTYDGECRRLEAPAAE